MRQKVYLECEIYTHMVYFSYFCVYKYIIKYVYVEVPTHLDDKHYCGNKEEAIKKMHEISQTSTSYSNDFVIDFLHIAEWDNLLYRVSV